jgi:hypothetical protein
MSLAASLAAFQAALLQSDVLIADAHRVDAAGAPLFSKRSQQQITIAAFLNFFIAWETLLEEVITKLMSGEATTSGRAPLRRVSPASVVEAHSMLIGVARYFDFANIDNVRKMCALYFDAGYPFEPHLSGIAKDLWDLKAMRNASAHITTTTQRSLEAVAQSILGRSVPDIDLYTLLLSRPAGSAVGATVYSEYKSRIDIAAGLIVAG